MSKSALPQSKPIAPPDSTRSRGEIREALRESENRYRVLIEGLGEGILYCDRNDTIIQVNSRMAELSGHSIEAMLGKRACELLVAEQHRELFRAKTAQRLQGVTESYELQFVRKDGSLFWATISATPIRNAGGEIVGTLGAITDVTKRKEAELALEAQREFLKLVIDTNPSLIFARDRAGRFTLANKATAEVYGSRSRAFGERTRKCLLPAERSF